jgi:hypothetical protein
VPVAAFPTHATLYRPFEEEREPDYAVSVSPPFVGGGRDLNLDADLTPREFFIRYTGLTEAEAASITTHAAAAKYSRRDGSAYVFSFTTRAGEVLANVRYAPGGYTRTHNKTWNWTVEVILIKEPS